MAALGGAVVDALRGGRDGRSVRGRDGGGGGDGESSSAHCVRVVGWLFGWCGKGAMRLSAKRLKGMRER